LPELERLTERHLQTAERNRGISSMHLAVTPQTLPKEWSAVVAFYAAVHYVNAYLWEIRRYAPPDHDSRNRLVAGDVVLGQCRFEYRRLLDAGFRARYVPNFQLTEQIDRDLIEVDLERVRQTVRGALGLSSSS
jgi:hypothetical protein